jgi:hypothetical protein
MATIQLEDGGWVAATRSTLLSGPQTLPAGTRVFSSYPGWPSEGKVLKRSQRVQVGWHAADRIIWVGQGGYWKWAKLRVDG